MTPAAALRALPKRCRRYALPPHSETPGVRMGAAVLSVARASWIKGLYVVCYTERHGMLPCLWVFCMTTKHRIFTTSFASVYPLYVAKAEKKGRKKSEVDAVICWLTGYSQHELEGQLKKRTDFETFFKEAPKLNPSRTLIKGVICGVRVEDIQEPTMREIRYLDKLVDELAKGKTMDKIMRA